MRICGDDSSNATCVLQSIDTLSEKMGNLSLSEKSPLELLPEPCLKKIVTYAKNSQSLFLTSKTLATRVKEVFPKELADMYAPYVLSHPHITLSQSLPPNCFFSKRFLSYMLRKNGEEYSSLKEDVLLRKDPCLIKTTLTYFHLFCPEKLPKFLPSLPQDLSPSATEFSKSLSTINSMPITRESWNQFGLGVLGTKFLADADIGPIVLKQRRWVLNGPESATLVTNRAIMEIEVQENGLALELCSEDLKKDIPLVQLAVKQNGLALEHALEPARSNFEVNMIAVSQNWRAVEHVPPDVLINNEILVELIKSSLSEPVDSFSDKIPDEKFTDIEFARLALPLRPDLFPSFSEHIRSDEKLALQVLRVDGTLLDSVHSSLKNKPTIYLEALRNTINAIQAINEEVLADIPSAIQIVRANKDAYKYLPANVRNDVSVKIAAGQVFD